MCRAYCGRKKQKSHCIICKCIHATIQKYKFSETNLWFCANWCHGQFCCRKFRGDQLLLIWQCCWLWSSRQMYWYLNKYFWRPIILVWHWCLAFFGLQIACIKNALWPSNNSTRSDASNFESVSLIKILWRFWLSIEIIVEAKVWTKHY